MDSLVWHCELQVLIGNRVWMTSNNVGIEETLEERISYYEEKGQTVVLASIDGKTVIPCVEK